MTESSGRETFEKWYKTRLWSSHVLRSEQEELFLEECCFQAWEAGIVRVEELVAEVRRLRGLVECIETVACSEAFRKLSQQGYGDIEELCKKALGSTP